MRTVSCPECDEAIEIDSEMEGRRVACPECGAKFTVPERGGRRKSGAGKKRRKPAGPNWGLIVGLTLGAVALVVGVAVIVKATRPKPAVQTETAWKSTEQGGSAGGGDGQFKLPFPTGGGEKSAPASNPAPPSLPPGWAKYTLREAGLSAHFPGDPGEAAKGSADMGVRVTDYQWDYDLPNDGGGLGLTVMVIPTGTTLQADQEAMFLRYPRHAMERQAKAKFVAERAATFGRFKATELEYVLPTGEPVATRYGFVRSGERQMFVVATAGGKAVTPSDRAAFFDSVRPAN